MSMNEIEKNEVLTQVFHALVKQTEKGLKKYGNTVDPREYSTIEWIDHAIEEGIDQIVYLTVLKQRIKEGL